MAIKETLALAGMSSKTVRNNTRDLVHFTEVEHRPTFTLDDLALLISWRVSGDRTIIEVGKEEVRYFEARRNFSDEKHSPEKVGKRRR